MIFRSFIPLDLSAKRNCIPRPTEKEIGIFPEKKIDNRT